MEKNTKNNGFTEPMRRVEAVLSSPVYNEYLEKIRVREETRRFCVHDRIHFRETAHAACILYLSGEIPCPELEGLSPHAVKEMIYAAAYLHDIGRFRQYDDSSLCHGKESAVLARPLLAEAGFSHAEAEIILKAIANHRREGDNGFDLLLYRADKLGRSCFDCPALKDCKKFQNGNKPALKL